MGCQCLAGDVFLSPRPDGMPFMRHRLAPFDKCIQAGGQLMRVGCYGGS